MATGTLRPEAPAWYPGPPNPPPPFAQVVHQQPLYIYHPIPGVHFAQGFYPILPYYDYTYFPPPPYQAMSSPSAQVHQRSDGDSTKHTVAIVKRPKKKKGGKKGRNGGGQSKCDEIGDGKEKTEVKKVKEGQNL